MAAVAGWERACGMGKIMTWCAGLALVVAVAGCGRPPAAAAGRAAGSWGRATRVPGLTALDKDRTADVLSVSCAAAGSCAAGGTYHVPGGGYEGFVADERNGRWGRAIAVPGLAALNTGGQAAVLSVSCSAAGDCAAGGSYAGRPHSQSAFAVVERNGVWGQAARLRAQEVSSVSCAPAGYCAVGGYFIRHLTMAGFVATERNGTWSQAAGVPGRAALNKGNADVVTMSCAAAGDCAAGGYYSDRNGYFSQAFVATERNGRWGTATPVPGLAALNKGSADAGVTSVSCGAAGSCAAVGSYSDRLGDHVFVADERNGRWGTAAGLGAPNKAESVANSVSCSAAGSCTVGGTFAGQAFVATERNGRWGTATGLPGLAALNKGGNAYVTTVSCASPGNCAVGGDYSPNSFRLQGFVATERNGVWGTAIQVPGLAALDKGGNARVLSISCAPAGTCAAGGYYTVRSQSGPLHEFVATDKNSH